MRRLSHVFIVVLLLMVLIIMNLPYARAQTVYVPDDYPSLSDALISVPDNSVIILKKIETVNSPINILYKRNVTVIGGGIKTQTDYQFPTILFLMGSKVKLVNFSIEGKLFPTPFASDIYLSAIHAVQSDLDLINTSIKLNNLTYSLTWYRTVGLIITSSDVSMRNVNITGDIGLLLRDAEISFRRVIQGPVNLKSEGLNIEASLTGISMGFSIPNNTVYIKNYKIKYNEYIGVSLFSIPGIDPRDMPLPGTNTIIFEGGSIIGKPTFSSTGIVGFVARSTSIIFRDLRIDGAIDGVSFRMGIRAGRGGIPMGFDILFRFEDVRMNVLENGFFFGEEGQLLSNNSLIFSNVTITPLSNTGKDAFTFVFDRYHPLYVGYKQVFLYLENISIYNFTRGFVGRIYYSGEKNIWVENFFFNNRFGYGLDLEVFESISDRSPTNPESIASLNDLKVEEDLYFAYSILWNFRLEYTTQGLGQPSESIVLFETVYDEFNSVSAGFTVYSIWTLETIVYSEAFRFPLTKVQVEYDVSPFEYSIGYTDPSGSYRYRFVYEYSESLIFIDYIYVEASLGEKVASTWYIPYINDTYTMPSWFGNIVLYLDVTAFRALGFSHKTGTSILIINGYTGYLDGFYSLKPNDINLNDGNGYTSYPIRVFKVIYTPAYLIIYSEILFNGYWQPYTIMVNLKTNIVYSTGPIDFRGVIIDS